MNATALVFLQNWCTCIVNAAIFLAKLLTVCSVIITFNFLRHPINFYIDSNLQLACCLYTCTCSYHTISRSLELYNLFIIIIYMYLLIHECTTMHSQSLFTGCVPGVHRCVLEVSLLICQRDYWEWMDTGHTWNAFHFSGTSEILGGQCIL